MSRLPFKTQPKAETVVVGSSEIGELEIKKLYDLTPNERLFIKEYVGNVDIRVEAAKISKAIAAKCGLSVLEVFNALSTANYEILVDHLEEVVEFEKQSREASERRYIATVTAIIKYRLADSWTIEDTQNPVDLPPRLKQAIYKFASSEEMGWQEPEQEELTEEALGKLEKA